MDEHFTKEEKYRQYGLLFLFLGVGAAIATSIVTALLIKSNAHPLTVVVVFLIGSITGIICAKYGRKYDAIVRKIIIEDIEHGNKKEICFSMSGELKMTVDRTAEALGISQIEVVGNALQTYIAIADQFAAAKGQERIVEITDGKTLQKIFNIAGVLPHHKSHLKVIK